MNRSALLISQLFSIRNRYGKNFSIQKINLLEALDSEDIKRLPVARRQRLWPPVTGKAGKKAIETYYNILLFLLAYPDNQTIYQLASGALQKLQVYIASHESLKRFAV
jgi:hypothetical protein